jgi:hypothetical protein
MSEAEAVSVRAFFIASKSAPAAVRFIVSRRRGRIGKVERGKEGREQVNQKEKNAKEKRGRKEIRGRENAKSGREE